MREVTLHWNGHPFTVMITAAVGLLNVSFLKDGTYTSVSMDLVDGRKLAESIMGVIDSYELQKLLEEQDHARK